MKTTMMKKTFVAVTLLSAAGYGGIVSAHDMGGGLGSAIGATDVYQVGCYNDGNGAADHLAVHILDLKPVAAPVLSAQVFKYPLAANTTDQVDGDATYSPFVKVKGGNGPYYVLINKTKAGIESYSVQFHCETAKNAHTGTDEPIVIQNK